ncbi:Protein dfg16, putative [Candida maltosa Xu316]|uniref:Protein dfg16, putative n=1 Tax=Candida maltosa (strain Xu316) TaxID=1245528 RepID=M3JFL5_CANMX|nr:Protein dfg16, putative [Candida maltosa Xu316]
MNTSINPDYLSFDYSPYNKRDNGDTFVALLFVLCGSCVSMWMLTLLLYVSPKYKRKPILTQLATMFYAIFTTYLLSKATRVSERQYYDDVLDIIELHTTLYNTDVYRVLITIEQVLAMSAWFQIIQKIARQKFKRIIGIFSACLMAAYFGCFIYYQIVHNVEGRLDMESTSPAYTRWKIVRNITKLAVVLWFGGNILYYTTVMKNPRKICYSRRLIPLAFFNWFLIILHIVLDVLYVSLFRDNWLVRTWMLLIPFLIECILATTVWEWIFNIWIIEKRYELMGVLGRRISIDDVLSIQSDTDGNAKSKKVFNRSQLHLDQEDSANKGVPQVFTKTWDWIMNKQKPMEQNIESISITASEDLKQCLTFSNSSSNDNSTSQRQQQQQQPQRPAVLQLFEDEEDEDDGSHDLAQGNSPANSLNGSLGRPQSRSDVSYDDVEYDDEYVNDYEIWDDDDDDDEQEEHDLGEGGSHQVQLGQTTSNHDESPPPFQPHPGFNAGDYWNDRKEG